MTTTTLTLRKATRTKLKARIGLSGASGSGKTYSALRLAAGLCEGNWGKVAIIDTENGRGELYVNTTRHNVTLGEYNCLTLDPPFTPERYLEAITVCEQAGMEVIIIDSLSHAWAGTGGMLEMKDALAKSGRAGVNDYTAWRDITPKHTALVEKLLRCEAHLIVCTRAKTEYVLEDMNGKKVPKKVGMAPIFRDGLEYEMTVWFDISPEHVALASKDNTGLFDLTPAVLSEDHGKAIRDWLEIGVEAPARQPATSSATVARQSRDTNAGSRTTHAQGGATTHDTGVTLGDWRIVMERAGLLEDDPARPGKRMPNSEWWHLCNRYQLQKSYTSWSQEETVRAIEIARMYEEEQQKKKGLGAAAEEEPPSTIADPFKEEGDLPALTLATG